MAEHSPGLSGRTLGNYQLEQLIEQSEAGSVFVARNITAGEKFRVRVLAVPPNLTPEDRIVYLGRFQQEANRVASLQHTYILPVVDYGTQIDVSDPKGISWPYLVSPHLTSRSLSAQLARHGPMDDTLLVSRYLDQIAAALEYAHKQAILHRNLTTDCIFIKQDGNLLVADFGVMRMLEGGARLTASNAETGTFGMNEASAPAPEQILGRPVDTYTDVYALGAVLYRVLTGHRVFRGKTREELIQQHLQAPIPSLETWRKGLPRELDSIIARAMAKEPAQRFRQPGELANAFHSVVAPGDTKRVPFYAGSPSPTVQEEGREHGAEKRVGEVGKVGEHREGESRARIFKGGASPAPARVREGAGAPISRRRALSLIAVGGGAAAIVAVAVFGSRYLVGNTSPTNAPAANTTGQTSNHVLARTSDVAVNNAKTFPIAGDANPGLLIHLPDGRFVAFDSTCTHAGCAVSYNPQDKLLECPCHGSVFDPAKNAAVVQGPAQKPLAPVPISVNANGTITAG